MFAQKRRKIDKYWLKTYEPKTFSFEFTFFVLGVYECLCRWLYVSISIGLIRCYRFHVLCGDAKKRRLHWLFILFHFFLFSHAIQTSVRWKITDNETFIVGIVEKKYFIFLLDFISKSTSMFLFDVAGSNDGEKISHFHRRKIKANEKYWQ